MPVRKCSNGKWKIGSGPCMYHSKEKAERAYAAYRAQKHSSIENEITKAVFDRFKIWKENVNVRVSREKLG